MKPLRKKHLLAWRLLAVLLPAGIIIASLSLPVQLPQQLLQPGAASPLPIVLKKADRLNYTVAIRSNTTGSALQLEWINKTVLQYPTATIYAGENSKDISTAKLVGRIEARGNWYFALDSTFKTAGANHFIVYDFIHQQVIDTINCTP